MATSRTFPLAIALHNYLATFTLEARVQEAGRLSQKTDDELADYLERDARWRQVETGEMLAREITPTDMHALGGHGLGGEDNDLCNLCVQENLLRMAYHA